MADMAQLLEQAQREHLVDLVVLGEQHIQAAALLTQTVPGNQRLDSVGADGQQDGVEQVGRFDRSAQVGLDAQRTAARGVAALAGVGGHQPDRRVGEAMGIELLEEAEGAHVAQVGVGDDGVVAHFRSVAAEAGERFGAAGAGVAQHVPAFDHAGEVAATGFVAGDHQDAQAAQVRFGRACDGRRGRRCTLEAGGEMEGAALAGLAVDPQPSLHAVDQLRADGQAQAGAAEAPGGRGVGLGKGVEDQLLFVFGDSDTAVFDREFELRAVGAAFGQPHMDRDVSTLGKFEGIANQVDEHLPQAMGVADEVVGNGGGDMVGEAQLLALGGVLEGAVAEGDTVAQAEADALEVELARGDLGVVEQVVDEAEQGVGGVTRQGQVFALLVVETGFEGEVGHADDGIHRGADFMAHVGQKIAFGLIGGLGQQLGCMQGLLGPLAFADVTQVGREARSAIQVDGHNRQLGGEGVAVLAHRHDFDLA